MAVKQSKNALKMDIRWIKNAPKIDLKWTKNDKTGYCLKLT